MRFGDLPRVAQLYVTSVLALALALTALAASTPSANATVELFILLTLGTTIAHCFPVSTPLKHTYYISLPLLVAALIVLGPLQLVGLVVVIHVGGWMRRRRRRAVTQIFNIAAYVVTGLAAQALYHGLWTAQAVDLSQPSCLIAAVCAAVAFAMLNRLLVSLAIWLGNGLSPRNQHLFEIESLLIDGVMLLMGVPLAHLAQIAPWGVAVGAAPLWLIHRVLDLPNIRAQSRQDGLTELFTAPYLTETCTREINRGRRFNRPLCLLLLDLDALGELNANHGHQSGDLVLRATARVIGQALREYDLPARLAGGLFAVLLPETDLAQAQAVAERIRRTAAEKRHEIPGSVERARVTLSIGGAIVTGQQVTATELFEAAQSALDRAKREGGNQIEFEAARTLEAATSAEPEAEPAPATTVATPARNGRWFTTQIRARRRALALYALVTAGLALYLIRVVGQPGWELLATVLGLAGLAGMAFHFKSLPMALALAGEMNRSGAGLLARRYWRMWPQYASIGIGCLLVLYAWETVGLTAALAVTVFALLVQHMAGRYVDRTLESVRTLRNTNEALEHQAFHDALTGVPNRALFAERLEHAMLRAGKGSVAVLFIDLDNFKSVNDTFGHAAGDALLVSTTGRLLQCVRRADTIARLGGDEFTVLLEDMHDPSDAARMAERIGETLRLPFELDGRQVVVSSSIGIALDVDRTHRPDDLLREADMAMYRAKSAGKSRYEIFDPAMAERATERLELESELRQAVARGELGVRYRSVFSLATDRAELFEAVLRWHHPRRGWLEADEFLRVAEESGVIVELGAWTLEQACRDAAEWQSIRPGVAVQVRLTRREFEQGDVVRRVASTLQVADLDPRGLCVEVSESLLADDAGLIASALDELAKLGVRTVLADVGAGPSSLAVFSQLSIDELKLAPGATASSGLVRASVALAATFGITVTALGVEQPDQADRLAALGCHRAQGSLYGEWMVASAVADFLEAESAQERAA